MPKKVLLLLSFLMLIFPLYAYAAANPSVLFVFDASGSMWGQINGKTKIEMARKAMTESLKSFPQHIDIGLIAYGHRKEGDCGDIELLAPIGSDRNTLIGLIEGINPKGKTPLSKSIEFAAAKLKEAGVFGSIIVVSDGKESCNADPCKLAEAIRSSGSAVRIHVVGFDVIREEADQLRCIAESGGGKYFPASSAGELVSALAEVQVRMEEPATPDPTAPGNLRIYAVLSAGGEPVNTDRYKIYREQLNASGAVERIEVASYPLHARGRTFSLPPGEYVAVIQHGYATAEKHVSVEPDKYVEAELVLNAGKLRIYGVETEDGPPVKTDYFAAHQEIIDKMGRTSRRQVGYFNLHDTARTFVLPSGEYIAEIRHGQARAEQRVTVEAGNEVEAKLLLQAGKLHIHAVMVAGGEAVNTDDYAVYREVTDASGKVQRMRVAYYNLHATSRTFVLPAGDYSAVIRFGAATTEQRVKVEGGKLVEKQLLLNAGKLHMRAVMTPGGSAVNTDDYTVYALISDQAGKLLRKRVAHYNLHATGRTFVLPAGDYVARIGVKGIAAEKKIHVEPGNVVDAELLLELKTPGYMMHLSVADKWTPWESNYGTMGMQDTGVGKLTAFYLTDDQGRLFLDKDKQGGKGYWIEASSGQRCDQPRDGSHYWGRAKLEFNENRDAFTIRWGYCDDEFNDKSWRGRRL